MSEMTKAERFQQFRELAHADAAEAGRFFTKNFLKGPTVPDAREQFLSAVTSIATSFDGADYQTPQSFESTLSRITDKKVHGVLEGLAATLLRAPRPAAI